MPGLDNVDLLFLVFSDVICYPEDAAICGLIIQETEIRTSDSRNPFMDSLDYQG